MDSVELVDSQEVSAAVEEENTAEQTLPLSARVGCLLFVATNPITPETIAKATGAELEEVITCLEELQKEFIEEKFGFGLIPIGDAWQLRTSAALQKTINKIIPAKAKKLSRAAAETLSIVAYRQPVQRAEIEAIRGVDAMQTVKTLLDARLIRIVGRESSAGQPALYGTTDKFLEKFGLSDLSELPTVRELQELEEEPLEPEIFSKDSESDDNQEDDSLENQGQSEHNESEHSEEE